MNIQKAYQNICDAVASFQGMGITAAYTTSPHCNDAEFVKRYNGPRHLAPELWQLIDFTCSAPESKVILEVSVRTLRAFGIEFIVTPLEDGKTRWEIDYGFTYRDLTDDEKANIAQTMKTIMLEAADQVRTRELNKDDLDDLEKVINDAPKYIE